MGYAHAQEGFGIVIRRVGIYTPLISVEYLDEAVANGRHLTPGIEVSVKGERGRFRFINAQMTSAGKLVLNFVGGAAGHEVFRSFYPERIRRVHRIARTRQNRKEE